MNRKAADVQALRFLLDESLWLYEPLDCIADLEALFFKDVEICAGRAAGEPRRDFWALSVGPPTDPNNHELLESAILVTLVARTHSEAVSTG